jgi:hypothetical protein
MAKKTVKKVVKKTVKKKVPAKKKAAPVKKKVAKVKKKVAAGGDVKKKVAAGGEVKKKVKKVKKKAVAEVKKAAPEKKKKVAKVRRAAKIIRLKAFWGVFNQSLRRVALFEFSERKKADEKAAELSTNAKGTPHFVMPVKEAIEG